MSSARFASLTTNLKYRYVIPAEVSPRIYNWKQQIYRYRWKENLSNCLPK